MLHPPYQLPLTSLPPPLPGLNYSLKQCRQYLAQFDIDCSGFIEEEELITLLQNFAEELNAQLRELSGHLIIACPVPAGSSTGGNSSGANANMHAINLMGGSMTDDVAGPAAIALTPDLPGVVSASSKSKGVAPCPVIRYIPPAKGILSMTVVDSLLAKVRSNQSGQYTIYDIPCQNYELAQHILS